ncbi:MAG: hypothetical protein V2B14_07325 [bacterium]
MKNFAFLKIFLIFMEKIARLETFYEEKILTENNTNVELLKPCKISLNKIKAEILSNRQILLDCYENKLLSKDKVDKALLSLGKCVSGFLKLHSLLIHLSSNSVIPETFIFLEETLKKQEKLSDINLKIVLLTQDFLTRNAHKDFSSLPFLSEHEKMPTAMYLPILENTNPLYWVLLVKNVFLNLDKLKVDSKTIISNLIEDKFNEEQQKIVKKLVGGLISDLFTIRLFGPAYFYLMIEMGILRSIAESDKRYLPTLAIREELIYNELIKLNLADKVENTHRWFNDLAGLSNQLHANLGFQIDLPDLKVFLSNLVDKLNEEVNKILDESVVFKTNDFQKSLVAYERLKDDILISSSYMFELNEIKTSYEKACNQTNGALNIYDYLNKLKEIPNTPQQIVNAGWIYKENTIDKAFLEFLSGNVEFDFIGSYVKKLDDILIKSIETSRIHCVLLS